MRLHLLCALLTTARAVAHLMAGLAHQHLLRNCATVEAGMPPLQSHSVMTQRAKQLCDKCDEAQRQSVTSRA
jgi:hypothetical protein